MRTALWWRDEIICANPPTLAKGGPMTRLLFILATMTFSMTAAALECTGINQWVEATPSGEQMKVEQVELEVVIDDPSLLRMSADLGQTPFFVQGDKNSSQYMLLITLGSNYVEGVTTTMTWDQKSEMRMARVDGTSVYKLKCY